MRAILSAMFLFLTVVSGGYADETPLLDSGPVKAELLELYTSEGCSSCPPGDRFFSSFKNSGGLWTRFVPVAFHVDYWDYIGWKDRFARAEFSDRQRRFASQKKLQTVYTPMLVRDGRESRDWKSLFLQGGAGDDAGRLRVFRTATHYRVVFEPAAQQKKESGWVLCGALLGMGLRSDVSSGENAGRVLAHDFVVLSYQEKDARAEADGIWSAEWSFERPFAESERTALAFWAVPKNGVDPAQAVGGWDT